MTDLHTHILPGMDDGSRNVEMSLAMLRAEGAQGIDRVVFTPHFYRDIENIPSFLHRRDKALDELKRTIDALSGEEREKLPAWTLGAEVAWVQGVGDWSELRELCYEGTKYLLLEPPMQQWNEAFFNDVYNMLNRGITPVIAHIDRSCGTQKRDALERLYEFGLPTQISAEPFLHMMSKGRMFRCMERSGARLLISDCHDTDYRPPNLGSAMTVFRKKYGADAEAFFDETDELLMPAQWLTDE